MYVSCVCENVKTLHANKFDESSRFRWNCWTNSQWREARKTLSAGSFHFCQVRVEHTVPQRPITEKKKEVAHNWALLGINGEYIIFTHFYCLLKALWSTSSAIFRVLPGNPIMTTYFGCSVTSSWTSNVCRQQKFTSIQQFSVEKATFPKPQCIRKPGSCSSFCLTFTGCAAWICPFV